MKQLEINITKAALKSFTVSVDKDQPSVSATIALLTEGGKAITSYTISTTSWQEKDKFDLPVSAIKPMAELAKILESVVVRHCKDSQLAIGDGAKETDDIPINLDEIPF